MKVNDLLRTCCSFRDDTLFYCYGNEDDFCVGGPHIACFNKDNLRLQFGKLKLKRFYIYHSGNRVDILIDFNNLFLKEQ